MYNGLLHLHNFLRWIILILLIVSIAQSFAAKSGKPANGLKKSSLFLLISAHITLLIGLYQYFAGPVGYKTIQEYGMSEVMKNTALRFWSVEHITGMLIGIVLITIARGKVKKAQFSSAGWLYIVALLIILATVPWPFRAGIGRALFPGM
ncbi:MAG: hypothetical protein EOO02_22165 [Chitinophagaceae bacterium]|nr:MAG: hypothetical protein EOO02_22165 [Chitinophagaceae bacterium]